MYQEDNLPVEIYLEDESCRAFVVTIGVDYVLTARLSQMSWLNGFRAISLTEIDHVLPLGKIDERFVCRAMQARSETIPPKCPFSANSLRECVEKVGQEFPIVIFFVNPMEEESYDVGGKIERVTDGVVTVKPISKEGYWEPENQKIEIRFISEIIFGSEYEKTLWQVVN